MQIEEYMGVLKLHNILIGFYQKAFEIFEIIINKTGWFKQYDITKKDNTIKIGNINCLYGIPSVDRPYIFLIKENTISTDPEDY